MRSLIAVGALALMFAPGAYAQQGRQATGDATQFKQGVQALPSTPKRQQIIRSERSTRTNSGHHSTMGSGPVR